MAEFITAIFACYQPEAVTGFDYYTWAWNAAQGQCDKHKPPVLVTEAV